MELNKNRIDTIIRFALKEDIWKGDITSECIFTKPYTVDAVIVSRAKGTVCGLEIVERVFSIVDPTLRFKTNGCRWRCDRT